MISVIIPAYNEEKTVGEVIDKIRTSLKGKKYEIIIVDDFSSDSTYKIAKYKNVKIIRHKKRTFGDVFLALRKAKGNIIVRMDADLEHDPNDLPKMINYFEKNNLDLVLGKRPHFSRKVEYLLNKLYNFPIKDMFTGYIIFSRRFLPIILKYKMRLYWEFPIYAIRKRLRVGEIDVNFKKREGKARFGGEIIGGLKTIKYFIEAERKISKVISKFELPAANASKQTKTGNKKATYIS